MKTIGLLGGMSWESTTSYYQQINRGVQASLGGLHSAKVILNSVDFVEIESLQHAGDWQGTADILIDAAKGVELAGADFLLICTNTMHKVADTIQEEINIPILHIADATAEKLMLDGVSKVGLLGTQFTMEQAFYKQRLTDRYGIEVVVPDPSERELVHSVIYNELCKGVIDDRSRQRYLDIINKLRAKGAEAVILGCTEIALLVQQTDTPVKLYDTTAIHVECAVSYALKKDL